MERELVIVDDCSIDGTHDILQRWPRASPKSASSGMSATGARAPPCAPPSRKRPAIFR